VKNVETKRCSAPWLSWRSITEKSICNQKNRPLLKMVPSNLSEAPKVL
jgi:hypothetical protein